MIVQSDAQYRQNPEDLTRLYTRNNNNQMVPLSSVVTTQWTCRARTSCRISTASRRRRSTATPRRGYSSGDAIAAMEAVAKEVLPPGYTFAWSGLAFEEKQSGGTSGARVRVRLHHRVPGARRAVRIVDAAGRGDDGGAVRHPRRAAHQSPARPRQRRVLPDRPAGADRARRQERRAARVGCRRLPQPGQVDHGSDASSRASSGCARSS